LDEVAITQDIQDANYSTEVLDRLVATPTVLQGSHYTIDNTILYKELKHLVLNGAGWLYPKFQLARAPCASGTSSQQGTRNALD
jgi:hypothetical protein